jgi:hypothetical protein
LLLFLKYGHFGCPLCIVHAIQHGDGGRSQTHPVTRCYISIISYSSLSHSMEDILQPPSELRQAAR